MYVSRHKSKFIKSAQTPQGRRSPVIDFQNEIEMYVRREGQEEGVENGRGRRFIRWAFTKRLRTNQTAAIMVKLSQNINRAFYIRYNYAYVLVNNETGLRMVYYKQQRGSPWINNFAEAERWMNEQENNRLNLDNIERPNTKWTFIKFSNIEVKAVLDNQPMLGTGPLPDWLRNLARGGHQMVSLDNFGDNLCLWCCIAVYRGARPDRCTQSARRLARGFFKSDTVPRTCLGELDKVEQYLNKEKQLQEWIGIRVYEPEQQENGEIHWHLRRNPSYKLKNIMTIGIYEGHAFLIRDIAKLAKIYVCNDCSDRFTKACNLQRHAKTCNQGETEIKCPEEKIKKPLMKYEEAFNSFIKTSPQCHKWLEKEEKRLGFHIHHASCGHGGERCLLGSPVDGYEPKSRTVFEFVGCFYHGCPRCVKTKRNEPTIIGKTPNQLYYATLAKTEGGLR